MNLPKIILLTIIILLFASCKAPAQKNIEPHFYSFDNSKIAFTDEGTGEPVILIHGFIQSGSNWNKTVLKKSLIEKGFRVIIPDLRGNGKSDKPQFSSAYDHNAEIKDLIKLADHLKLQSYSAIGYSRGSIVLAKLLTQEKRISKAVFGGMGVDFTNPDWERRIAFADAFTGRKHPNSMTRGAIEYAKSINADLKVLGFLQDHQPVTSLDELQDIKIKTLVVCGDQDKDNGSPEELNKALSNSSLIIVKGDHNNTYKQENFAEATIGFLLEK